MLNRQLNDDTITALSTPPGIGGIAVVRISGEKSLQIINKLLPKSRHLSSKSHGIATPATIIDEKSQEPIDEVIVTYFRGPNSYTTEDLVEISCHGGLYVQGILLELITDLGARVAEPGEFTKRAFLGGRIDLSQAEGVADIIAAKVESAHKSSLLQIQGNIKRSVKSLRSRIIEIAALIEAELDFSEDEIEHTSNKKLAEMIKALHADALGLLQNYGYGKILREGALVPIIGKPNAGKSSLLNAILNSDRAIVTPTPGTTRDTIEEEVELGGYLIRLVDTAGLRESGDNIEQIGIDKSISRLESADLTVWLLDRSTPIENEDLAIFERLEGKNYITIESKVDLERDASFSPQKNGFNIECSISSLTGEGMEALGEKIAERVSEISSGEAAIITNARHANAIKLGAASLQMAVEAAKEGRGGEYLAVDLREAMDHLGELTGEVTTDDILNEIFGKFCVGK